jgi:hypothetical protein
MAIYNGFTHQKWLFSIAMLVYQRVLGGLESHFFGPPRHIKIRMELTELQGGPQ